MAEVIVYGNQSCPFCTRARKLLDTKGVEYLYKDITGNSELRDEARELSGRRTIPQIFINGHHVGGCDDLHAAEDSGELDRLLQG